MKNSRSLLIPVFFILAIGFPGNALGQIDDYGKCRFGAGVYYQEALYFGNISDFVKHHGTVMFFPFNFDFYYKKFNFNISYLNSGFSKIEGVNVNGDFFTGNFYGTFYSSIVSGGYEIINNSSVSIIPNLGYAWHLYSAMTQKEGWLGIHEYANVISEFQLNNFTIGALCDFKVIDKAKFLHNGYLAIRLRYDLAIPTDNIDAYSGSIHQITIGLAIVSISFKKNQYKSSYPNYYNPFVY
jgi:hypothetical protein